MEGKRHATEDKIRILWESDRGEKASGNLPGSEHLGSGLPLVESAVWANEPGKARHLNRLGTFGGASIQLYEEGSRAFEGLLGEWRKRHSHRVLDRVKKPRKSIRLALHNWVNSFGLDLAVKGWGIRRDI